MLDRDNLDETGQESGFTKSAQAIKGVTYVITGDVTDAEGIRAKGGTPPLRQQ